jgi:hypothetical protein
MNLLHHRQLRLLFRTVTTALRLGTRLGLLRQGTTLRGFRKQLVLHLRQLLAQPFEFLLQTSTFGLPAQRGDLADQVLHPPMQTVVLFLEQLSEGSEGVRILYRIERSHDRAYFIGLKSLWQDLFAKAAAA